MLLSDLAFARQVPQERVLFLLRGCLAKAGAPLQFLHVKVILALQPLNELSLVPHGGQVIDGLFGWLCSAKHSTFCSVEHGLVSLLHEWVLDLFFLVLFLFLLRLRRIFLRLLLLQFVLKVYLSSPCCVDLGLSIFLFWLLDARRLHISVLSLKRCAISKDLPPKLTTHKLHHLLIENLLITTARLLPDKSFSLLTLSRCMNNAEKLCVVLG